MPQTEAEKKKEKDEKAKLKKELEEMEKEEEATRKLEQQHPDWDPKRQKAFQFLEDQRTEYTLCFIIMSNLILLVMEADYANEAGSTPAWLQVLDKFMLIFFTAEMGLRIYAFRWSLFSSPGSTIDAVVVIVDLFFLFFGLAFPNLPTIGMMRIVRLARLTRVSQIIDMVPQLNIMVMSLVGACMPMFWGIIMLVMMLLVWAILSVQIIHPINLEVSTTGAYDGCDRCERSFASVYDSVLTYSQQIIAGDSWGAVTIPIIEYSPGTAIFFALVFISVNMAVLNVIMASVVDATAQARAANDKYICHKKEDELRLAYKLLEKKCTLLDTDGSGCLTFEELVDGYQTDIEFRMSLEAMDIKHEDLATVWDILDTDDSGDVSYKEFCDQVFKMKTSDMHTMLTFVKHYVKTINTQVKQTLGEMREEHALTSQLVKAVKEEMQLVNSVLNIDNSPAEATADSADASDPVAKGAAATTDSSGSPADTATGTVESCNMSEDDTADVTATCQVCKDKIQKKVQEAEAAATVAADESQAQVVASTSIDVPPDQNESSNEDRQFWQEFVCEQRRFMMDFAESMTALKGSMQECTRKFDTGLTVVDSVVPPIDMSPILGVPPQPNLWCGVDKEPKKQQKHHIRLISKDSLPQAGGESSSGRNLLVRTSAGDVISGSALRN